jgi:hypothetical protein
MHNLTPSGLGKAAALSISKPGIAPHTALLGAVIGAGVGGGKALVDGGAYDKKTGERDNRLEAVLKGMGGGAALGGLGGAAVPYVAGSPLYLKTVGKLHKKLLEQQGSGLF